MYNPTLSQIQGAIYHLWSVTSSSNQTIGSVWALFSGVGVYASQFIFKNIIERRDEKRIVKYLKKNRTWNFRNISDISRTLNMSEDRIKEICTNSNKFEQHLYTKCLWGLKLDYRKRFPKDAFNN